MGTSSTADVGRSGIHWASFRRLTRFVAGSGGLFAGSLALLFSISGLTAAKAWIVQPVVDAFTGGEARPGKLYLLCGLVAGIFLVQAGLNYGYAVLAKTAGAGMIRSIREALFRHLLGQTLGYFAVRQSADLTARVVHDIALFETAAVNAVQRFIRDLFTVVLLFSVMFTRSWTLALVCVGIAFVMGLILTRMNQQIRTRTVASQERLSAVAFQLTELIAGMEVVLSFGLGNRWLERFAATNDEHYRTGVALERTRAGTVFMVQGLVGLGVAAILLITGRALLLGEITPGQFGSFLAALYLLQTPLSALGDEITEIVRGLSAGERALAILDDAPVLEEPARPVPLPDGPFSLEFRGVSFAYAGQAVLEEVSFRVDEGELVAIVGDSGAGKSTIARLMLRFYDPTRGEVRLCGVPLPSIGRRDLHRAMSYVSQDVFLFDGTIRHNLTISDAGVSDEHIERVVDEACLRELVESLPDGLETHVGERGVLLSGGERQRIAVARALLSDPALLVLDEATSALDTDLERRLLRGLLDRGRGRTVIAISHRLRLAEIADRVLAMKDGRLAETGTPDELARHGGEYARLLAAAAGGGAAQGGDGGG